EADTVGVFQVESRAQAQVLPRLKPRCFADLIVAISLIRPGPVQGNMVHPYLRRRLGEEPVSYPHPLLEAALKETLGVVLFQEQVLKVAADLAGFTPGQGELLRRALGAKNPGTELERFREGFISGAVQKGVEATIAESVFEALRAFGSYSFPKSHAAAFAVLVYRSAWLKRYFAPAYFVALLNNQPMGFWSPAVLVNDMQRHGIRVLSVDIQRSGFKCAIEGKAVRLGFNYVSGVGELAAQRILDARCTRPFANLADFWARARLPRRLVEHLIQSGAMDAWGIARRDLLWELGTLPENEGGLDLVFAFDPVSLPPQTRAEAASMEFAVTGLSTGAHPMAFYREYLAKRGILNSRQLNNHPSGGKVWAAGLVVVHQTPPTAKGHHFITLEDEFGFINVVVRPHIDVRYGRLWRETPLLIVEGNVQKQGQVTNLVATKVSTFARD
ncbi:MAG: error-prone DNA polymerase, partial [Anaerolineae bacterium]|nr:error-prone DNA polymerase [Anaerolineae bacterium]